MKRKKLWFTLVELIITITILAILATVSFISIWNYAAQSRDTVRVSDLKILEKALTLSQIETGWYPVPLNATGLEEIDWIEWIKWKKWKFWEEQYLAVKRLDKLPLDPTSKETYDYYLSENGQYYRLESTQELSDEKIIVTNYSTTLWNWNSSDSTEETEPTLNIPETARLYWKIVIDPNEVVACNRDAWSRFTIENWIITDNITKLQWEESPSTGKVTWQEAKDNCANLTLWWYSDWRLPDITELRSIVNRSCYSPATYSWFNLLTSNYYWSSTTAAYDPSFVWVVNFGYGYYYNSYKTSTDYFICVR